MLKYEIVTSLVLIPTRGRLQNNNKNKTAKISEAFEEHLEKSEVKALEISFLLEQIVSFRDFRQKKTFELSLP